MKSERTKIDGIVKENIKKIEQFQNEVLRPILKQQHELFVESFQNYVMHRKIPFQTISKEQKEKHINSILSKDIAFKNFQIGMVVGQFSLEEFREYQLDSGEYNRRIVQMLKKRLRDTL
jgi:hypothetical protein